MRSIGKLLMKKRALFVGGSISLIMAYAVVMGKAFHQEEEHPLLDIGHWGVILLVAVICYVLIVISWNYLEKSESISTGGGERKQYHMLSNRERFVIWGGITAVLLMAWMPYWIAAFPGFFTYDASKEFVQAFYPEVGLKARFPILHSLLLRYTIKVCLMVFGSYQSGVAVFCLEHMILNALILSYEALFTYRLTRRRWLLILTVIYSALTPTIAMFSCCSNSTVFGSLVAIFFLIRYYEIFLEKDNRSSKRKTIQYFEFLMLSMLTCHLRGAFYLLYIGLFFSQLVMKEERKKRSLFMLLGLGMAVLFDQLLALAFHPEPSPVTEALSLPIQQISTVYVKEGEEAFSDAEMTELSRFFALSQFRFFAPQIADPIKLAMNEEECKKDMKAFCHLWIKLGIRFPEDYLNAANYLSYQAWYPFCDPDGYTRRNYVDSDYKTDYFNMIIEAPAEHQDLLPGVYQRISDFATMTDIYAIPVLGMLCTIGWQAFFLLYAVGYLIYSREKRIRILLLTELVYYIFTLMAPIVLVRYHLILFNFFPVVIASLFRKESDCETD